MHMTLKDKAVHIKTYLTSTQLCVDFGYCVSNIFKMGTIFILFTCGTFFFSLDTLYDNHLGHFIFISGSNIFPFL